MSALRAKRFPVLLAATLLTTSTLLFLLPSTAFAATTLHTGFDNMPAQNIVFDNLDLSKASFTSNNPAVSMKTTSNYNGRKAIVWKVTASGSKSLTNPFEVKFVNAGFDSKGNRVDLLLSCTSCKAQLYSGATAATREQVLMIDELPANDSEWNKYIQLTSLPDNGVSALYGIQISFNVKVYKTGTETTCSYPLLATAEDLDWYDETTSAHSWSGTYAESITLNSGYGANSYIADDSLLSHNSTNTRFWGSALDSSTDRSRVAFTISASGGKFTWAGSSCSTQFFRSKTFEITSSSGSNGSISPKGTSLVGWRTSKDFTATASTGYKISKLTVDGARVDASGKTNTTYSFSDIRADHTISASFTPIVYNIAFDGNGASSGSTGPLKSCKYNTAYTLPENGYSKSTHSFAGWNTKPDGTGSWYSPGDSVKNLTTEDGATVTLYAQWEDLSLARKATIRIPEQDFERAKIACEKLPVLFASFTDESEDVTWNYPIDLSDCLIEDGYARTSIVAYATESARCDLLDSALFSVDSREEIGLETVFTLALPSYSSQGASDCIVNHFPADGSSSASTLSLRNDNETEVYAAESTDSENNLITQGEERLLGQDGLAEAENTPDTNNAAIEEKGLFGGFCGRDSGIGPAQRAKTTIWN